MDAKDSIVVILLLLSLGLFSSLTYCVWNKQSQLASELDDLQNKLQELQNQVALNDKEHFQHSQVKGQLKRNVRQADGETDTLSAAEILTNALTEIIEMKLTSYMDCNRNDYNYTKCTLNQDPRVNRVILDHLGCREELDTEDHVDQKVTLGFWDHRGLLVRKEQREN